MNNTAKILKTLYDGDKEETDKYVRETLEEFITSVKDAIEHPELQEQLLKETLANGDNLMAVFFFIVKPAYLKEIYQSMRVLPTLLSLLGGLKDGR